MTECLECNDADQLNVRIHDSITGTLTRAILIAINMLTAAPQKSYV
jgi:hypothetical protein